MADHESVEQASGASRALWAAPGRAAPVHADDPCSVAVLLLCVVLELIPSPPSRLPSLPAGRARPDTSSALHPALCALRDRLHRLSRLTSRLSSPRLCWSCASSLTCLLRGTDCCRQGGRFPTRVTSGLPSAMDTFPTCAMRSWLAMAILVACAKPTTCCGLLWRCKISKFDPTQAPASGPK